MDKYICVYIHILSFKEQFWDQISPFYGLLWKQISPLEIKNHV